MPQIDFYILGQQDLRSKLLFACKIVQKVRDKNLKALVRTSDTANSEAMDRLLWTFRQKSFIPHAIITEGELPWKDYPVQISHVHHCPSQANVLINLQEGADRQCLEYERVVELVGSDQTDKDSGRQRYRYYRDQGLEPLAHDMVKN